MEKKQRTILYSQLEGRAVAYNPVEPEPFDLVDLTRDITNLTRIYHKRTTCVREALEGASLIVTDNQALAHAVKHVLPRAMVVALPFGNTWITSEPHERPVTPAPPQVRVGLLNHSGEMEMNNRYALKLLKALKREILVYGETLPGIEGETEEKFEVFAAKCDILLLPSLPGVINSTTLPLTLMGASTAILAYNAPGYYDLSAATGVQLLPGDPAAWRRMLDNLETQPVKLRTMQERNRVYSARLSRESLFRLINLAPQFVRPPAPLSEGCGCAKRAKSAPTQPNQDQPILEKESNS